MYEIDPTRLDLVAEFRRKPFGRHSAELQRILNRMRSEPFEGHYVLLRDGRFGPWRLAQLGRRPQDPVTPTGHVFASKLEAEWEVFKLRWQRLTGQELRDRDLPPEP
ncbi:hypothetical protein A8950_2556 [Dongia mobilis]|uniref:N,N-dimethylformamidase alpha subunit domain-containing protein n=2 Tax=Dongia mobilis TaxID=578943 RepID=A0A4R6WW40_9PROT|nr:hypothetical protein A8950_2556 [Dongia mobilis]